MTALVAACTLLVAAILSLCVGAVVAALRHEDASVAAVARRQATAVGAASRAVATGVASLVAAIRRRRSAASAVRFDFSPQAFALIEQRSREWWIENAIKSGTPVKPPGKDRFERMIRSAATTAAHVSGEARPTVDAVIDELSKLVVLELQLAAAAPKVRARSPAAKE